MTTLITLPALGESVTEGTVLRWLKAVGDDVQFEEPLLEVSTDKVDTEIPAPVAGRIVEINVAEDETVPVGAQLAVIEETATSESSATTTPPSAPPAATPPPSVPAPPPPPEPPVARPLAPLVPSLAAPTDRSRESAGAPADSTTQSHGSFVTPLVRKLAGEHGIDLSTVVGNGVGGRIRKQDVLAAVAALPSDAPPVPAAPPAPVDHTPDDRHRLASKAAVTPPTSAVDTVVAEAAHDGIGIEALGAQRSHEDTASAALNGARTERLSSRRKVIAARMVESLQTSAQLTSVVEVDVTAIWRHREAAKASFVARHGISLSYLPYFAKTTLEALREHPRLNASIDLNAGEVTYHDRQHLAIAVDTEGGLLTPVLRDAGDLSVTGLARNISDLAQRARNKKIGPDDLTGGTFTLTNTGSRGSLFDTPIINQPQVAVLGTGAVVKRVVVVDDPNLGETIAVRRMVYLALTYDHRLVDGADAARFLTDVKDRLESAAITL